MPTIELNRQFLEWCKGDLSDPELVYWFGGFADLVNWEAHKLTSFGQLVTVRG